MNFLIRSEGITDGIIDAKYGVKSRALINGIPQLSFPLEWQNAPEGTVSFTVVCIDYDNCEEEGYPWIHWSVANIPADVSFLRENSSSDMSEYGSRVVQGKNTWISQLPEGNSECSRYGGPAPAAMSHEYEIRIYALDAYLDIEDGFYYNRLLRAMRGRILGEAVTYGTYII